MYKDLSVVDYESFAVIVQRAMRPRCFNEKWRAAKADHVCYIDMPIGMSGRFYPYKRRRERLRIQPWMKVVLKVTVALTTVSLLVTGTAVLTRRIVLREIAAEKTAEEIVTVQEVVPEQEIVEEEKAVVLPAPPFEDIPWIPGVPRIILDPGHGGEDVGCFREGVYEKDINLEIAGLLEARLTEAGYQVIMTRTEDVTMTKEERVDKANYYRADIFVSIHQNSYKGKEVDGFEIWYLGEDPSRDNKSLAQAIHQYLQAGTGAAERVDREDSEIYVTNHTIMPACLIETGFLSNKTEREKLVSTEYQEKLADGIAEGIGSYFATVGAASLAVENSQTKNT